MKIAFIYQPLRPITFPVASSLDTWTAEVASRLARSCQVTVFARGYRFQKSREIREGVEYRNIRVRGDGRIVKVLQPFWKFRSPRRALFASSLFYPGWLLRTIQELRRENWDVVHIINFSQLVPLVRWACPKAKIILNMQCDWLTELDRRMIERRLQKADMVLACSDYVTNNIKSAFPDLADRCHTLWNGTDLTRFSPGSAHPHGSGGPAKRLLFVGRVSPEKGVHVLIEALPLLLERFPQVKLDIIGHAGALPRKYIVDLTNDQEVRKLSSFYRHEKYHSQLTARIRALGVESNVCFRPNLPHTQLVKHYQATDVFVFPSVFLEPFGMPVIEAMACGKPVVATRAGGMIETVVPGKTGLLVERANPRALADALIQILENEALATSMGEEARRRVQKYFCWDAIVENLLSLYKKSGEVVRDNGLAFGLVEAAGPRGF